MADDPVQFLRDTYAALARGDVAAVQARMNPAIEWHEPGLRNSPPPASGRVYLGPASVTRDVLEALPAAWDNVAVETDAFFGQGERVVVLGRFTGTAKATGRQVEAPFVHVCTVRDGTLCRLESFTDTARVLHALGAIETP